jgi:hypothetical protein
MSNPFEPDTDWGRQVVGTLNTMRDKAAQDGALRDSQHRENQQRLGKIEDRVTKVEGEQNLIHRKLNDIVATIGSSTDTIRLDIGNMVNMYRKGRTVYSFVAWCIGAVVSLVAVAGGVAAILQYMQHK